MNQSFTMWAGQETRGTIHIIAKKARGRPKPTAGGAACGREEGGRLKERTGFSLARNWSEETSTHTPCWSEATAVQAEWLRKRTNVGWWKESQRNANVAKMWIERDEERTAHQCDHVPCTVEQSRKTLAGSRGREEEWSMAHKRPNKENGRPRARRSASPMPSSQ